MNTLTIDVCSLPESLSTCQNVTLYSQYWYHFASTGKVIKN